MSNKFPFIKQIVSVTIIMILTIVFGLIIVNQYKLAKQKATITQIQTTYASLLTAIKMSNAENEDDSHSLNPKMPINKFAETYFTPYLKIENICKKGLQDDCWNSPQYKDLQGNKYDDIILYSLKLENGATIGFAKNQKKVIYLIVDINSKQGPNILGNDIFVMHVFNERNINEDCQIKATDIENITNSLHFGNPDKCGLPLDTGLYTYQDLTNKNLRGSCNKEAENSTDDIGIGSACAAALKTNGWTVDKIYPW